MTRTNQEPIDVPPVEPRKALGAKAAGGGIPFRHGDGEDGHIYSGEFKCHLEDPEAGSFDWTGRWSVHGMDSNAVELAVYADGLAFWLIVGDYVNGHFLCIPEWDVGCALSCSLTDTQWNYGRISRSMKPCDAMSVTEGLADFSRKTGWGR